jgi:hypothetical protein
MGPFQARVSVQIPNNGNTAQVKVTTVPNKKTGHRIRVL